jgi:hypothetical protein
VRGFERGKAVEEVECARGDVDAEGRVGFCFLCRTKCVSQLLRETRL